jgi:hypothetical protein
MRPNEAIDAILQTDWAEGNFPADEQQATEFRRHKEHALGVAQQRRIPH